MNVEDLINSMNLGSWAAIGAIVFSVVLALKKAFPKWIKHKEPRLALGLGTLLGVAALVSGSMTFRPGLEGWIQAILGGLLAGVVSQVVHDKGWNALLNKVKK